MSPSKTLLDIRRSKLSVNLKLGSQKSEVRIENQHGRYVAREMESSECDNKM